MLEWSRTMSANECLILDDDELEKSQVQVEETLNPRDLRTWIPATPHANPFTSQFISTAHSFPKVFHMKQANTYKEDFPKLSEREGPAAAPTTMNYRSRLLQKPAPKPTNLSTINVLERVREVLHDVSGQTIPQNIQSPLLKCRTCGGPHWTLGCSQNQEPEEQRYSPHTPPYPPDSPPYPTRSPPFIIDTPPINQIIYPIGTFLSSPIPPSSTPQ